LKFEKKIYFFLIKMENKAKIKSYRVII